MNTRTLTRWSALAVFAVGSTPTLHAQTTPAASAAANTDQLEEVIVTAERRTEDVQSIPAVITVLQGSDLREQGRTSVQQMLEDVPNVNYGVLSVGQAPDNITNNISIRGIETAQQTGGRPGPAVVGTYVDDVFQGIGMSYDLNRVEVLNGPQGTLYGRSATAGVVAFHTNDPVLGKFGTDIYAEYASNDLRNGTAVVNLPIGDTLAIRAAIHEDDSHGYWWNTEGGASTDSEGRVKLLWQPNDALRILLSASSQFLQTYAGGPQQRLIGPGEINYNAGSTAINQVAGDQYAQYMANIQYNFGPATLTYQGSEHSYHQNGFNAVVGPPFMPIYASGESQPDQFNMQELRLASNGDGALKWLVGANFYSNIYNITQASIVQSATQCGPCGIPDTTPGVAGGEIFANGFIGSIKDTALFTEETYSFTDAFKLTAGLRFDHSQVKQETDYLFNVNLDQYGQSLGTCTDLVAAAGSTPVPCEASSFNDNLSFNNVTFKVRAEYDWTPDNLVYAMVSTGYLPGDVQISPQPAGPPTFAVNYLALPYEQERLTSYEVGSKNELLDKRLQLNGDVFYYNYQGWQEAAQLGQAVGGAPIFTPVAVPLRIYGAELTANWLVTPDDHVKLSAGAFSDTITSSPTIAGTGHTADYYLIYKKLPGVAPISGMVSYDHVFKFENASTLVPYVEMRYSGNHRIIELSEPQVASAPTLPDDDVEAAYEVFNANVTWTSPQGTYGVTGYVRNIADKESPQTGNINQGFLSTIPLEPRIYGVSVNAKF